MTARSKLCRTHSPQMRGALLVGLSLLVQCSSTAFPGASSPVDVVAHAELLVGRSALSAAQFDSLRAAAEDGSSAKMYQLALLYLYGHTGEVTIVPTAARAAELMRRAAVGGYLPAQTAMGALLLEGRGVKRDEQAAVAWLSAAASSASSGDENAMWMLGVHAFQKRRFEEARAWFVKGLVRDPGHASSAFALAVMFEYGLVALRGEAREPADILRQCTTDPEVVSLANIDESGLSPSSRAAVALYRLAAGKGHLDGKYHLGLALLYGRGCPQDFVEAASVLQDASSRGHGAAAFFLGTLYMQGRGGVEVDYQRAGSLFAQAAASNDPRIKEQAERASADIEHLLRLSNRQKEHALEWVRTPLSRRSSLQGQSATEREGEPSSFDPAASLPMDDARRASSTMEKLLEKRQRLGDAIARARAKAREEQGIPAQPNGPNVFQQVYPNDEL
jgi:TPR repeat protein